MRAIILAAGCGLRLNQHTKDIPKALLDLNGKSILERQISLLREYGVNEIFVVTGYKREKYVLKDIEYIFNPRYSETEQLASMMAARTKIFDDVLVIFGDILFDSQILQQILASNDDIAMAIDLNWEKSYNEGLCNSHPLDEPVLINQKKVLRISYKQTDTMIENQTVGEFLGVIKLSANGSRTIIKKYEELEKSHVGRFHDANSLEKAKLADILQELIDSKIEISFIPVNGKWCEIDTPKDLERARKNF
jgi:choline kinase